MNKPASSSMRISCIHLNRKQTKVLEGGIRKEPDTAAVPKLFFFGPLEPIRSKQCWCLDLIVPKPPCWPIRPTLHIWRNSNDPCQSLPMPGMRAAPGGADFRSVRLGEAEG